MQQRRHDVDSSYKEYILYRYQLLLLERYMDLDPDPFTSSGAIDGAILCYVADEIEKYEKIHYPMD